MHVLHVINDLGIGGAEVMLEQLLRASRGGDPSYEVVSLMAPGIVGRRIEELGVRVHTVGIRREAPAPGRLVDLALLVRRLRPDVVQTWMYHSDLLGGIAARAAGRAPIVWGIHHSTLDARTTRWTTRATVAICARLSHRLPSRIVCVSRAARDLHVRAGYAAGKFVVIPNGFDVARFRVDAAARGEVRAELGLPPEAVVVALVARVAPQKDHANFVRAAAILARRSPEARFLLCGDGASPSNDGLVREIREAGVLDRSLLLGPRSDVPRLMNAVDVATLSSSHGEAFPLAVGEAMACGVPCVVTDVGDCRLLVGDAGRVVPPRDPEALAAAWGELVRAGAGSRRRLGEAARRRIEERFDVRAVAARYAEVYRSVAGTSAASGVAGLRAG